LGFSTSSFVSQTNVHYAPQNCYLMLTTAKGKVNQLRVTTESSVI